MFAYCGNNPINFNDPSGMCRRDGPNGTLIDCGSVKCPTSGAFRYYANSYKYADSYGAYVAAEASTFFLDWYYGTKGYGDRDGTITIGAGYSNVNQVGGSLSGGICIDGKGNYGLVVSPTGSAGTASKGFYIFLTTTDAPDIRDLEGASFQTGGSFVVGGEAVTFKGALSGKNHNGATVYVDMSGLFNLLALGICPSPEVHITGSTSIVNYGGNVRN